MSSLLCITGDYKYDKEWPNEHRHTYMTKTKYNKSSRVKSSIPDI